VKVLLNKRIQEFDSGLGLTKQVFKEMGSG